jgi:adenine-specific DNA-methyltransferase
MPELQFKGKEFVYNHHLTVPYRPLEMDAGKSIGKPNLNGNLIIHGDNLHALKALMPLYAGKVDCIFIDPPYNTGNENWSYNDNVNSPMMREWLSSNPVTIEDGLRHDKWCAMMYPRLKLLHELLSENGSFWMTLDDNEMHHARTMLDEIFGEQNFLACVVWEKGDSPRMDADYFSTRHDYVLAYASNKPQVTFHRLEEDEPPPHYKQEDESGRKYYLKPLRAMGGQGETREARPNLYYAMIAPDGTKVFPRLENGKDGAWRWSSKKVAKESDRIEWREGGAGWTPYYRIYADMTKGMPPETIFYNSEVGSSRNAKAQLKQIFPEGCPFDTPKPTGLIERILEIATGGDALVLDSFAGSGTTAHAVLTRNVEDGGNRRFILVECEEYANKLTAERVRRVMKGYKFEGMQREELLRQPLTLNILKSPERLLKQADAIENLDGHRFDRVKRELEDCQLVVTGEKSTVERVAGLGGEFAFCSLGEQLDLDKLLTGKSLPNYESIGGWLFHTATGESLNTSKIREKVWFLGEGSAYFVGSSDYLVGNGRSDPDGCSEGRSHAPFPASSSAGRQASRN